MTLFNSADPAIAAAHTKVLETLANIETAYGAVFVIDEYQQELRNAVAANHERGRAEAIWHAAAELASGVDAPSNVLRFAS